MIANDYKYFDIFITKILAAITNKYSKVTKSNFDLFVKDCDIDNNIEKKTISRTYKMKRFDNNFYYL